MQLSLQFVLLLATTPFLSAGVPAAIRPPGTNTIKIVVISDTHGRKYAENQKAHGDILIHAGDFVQNRLNDVTAQTMIEALTEIENWPTDEQKKDTFVRLITGGNHDKLLEDVHYQHIGKSIQREGPKISEDERKELERLMYGSNKMQFLHQTTKDIFNPQNEEQSIRIGGSAHSMRRSTNGFPEDKNVDLYANLDTKVDLLFTHGGMAERPDELALGEQTMSGDLNMMDPASEHLRAYADRIREEAIQARKDVLFVSGHSHGARGKKELRSLEGQGDHTHHVVNAAAIPTIEWKDNSANPYQVTGWGSLDRFYNPVVIEYDFDTKRYRIEEWAETCRSQNHLSCDETPLVPEWSGPLIRPKSIAEENSIRAQLVEDKQILPGASWNWMMRKMPSSQAARDAYMSSVENDQNRDTSILVI